MVSFMTASCIGGLGRVRAFRTPFLSVVCVVATVASLSAQTDKRPTPANELDAFMQKVLARREANRLTMNQYILDETEGIEVLGPGRAPLYRQKREFTWYVRDGMNVRSPVKFDGVGVDAEARDRYEQTWIRREQDRRERRVRREKDEQEKEPASREREQSEIAIGPTGIEISSSLVPEPRFVSEAYFMNFPFEPGNYYLDGRETLDGREVLRIEYYPTNFFKDDDTPEARKRDRGQAYEDRMLRRMNKTALITLWVDPAEHQIVKYTFENVWLDFLESAWLARVDRIGASMTMGQPFAGVWLPLEITIRAGLTLANGSYDAAYDRRFTQYRLAETSTTIRIPKKP
jgi:hypothetical protein